MLVQVVSQAEASGRVLVLPDLVEVQGKRFEEPTIIIASHVGGMEDIPVSRPLISLVTLASSPFLTTVEAPIILSHNFLQGVRSLNHIKCVHADTYTFDS